jgi:hypothetical protein
MPYSSLPCPGVFDLINACHPPLRGLSSSGGAGIPPREMHPLLDSPGFSAVTRDFAQPRERVRRDVVERPAKWRSIRIDSEQYDTARHGPACQRDDGVAGGTEESHTPLSALSVVHAQGCTAGALGGLPLGKKKMTSCIMRPSTIQPKCQTPADFVSVPSAA